MIGRALAARRLQVRNPSCMFGQAPEIRSLCQVVSPFRPPASMQPIFRWRRCPQGFNAREHPCILRGFNRGYQYLPRACAGASGRRVPKLHQAGWSIVRCCVWWHLRAGRSRKGFEPSDRDHGVVPQATATAPQGTNETVLVPLTLAAAPVHSLGWGLSRTLKTPFKGSRGARF